MIDNESTVEDKIGPRLLERIYYGAMQIQGNAQYTARERRLQAAFVIMSALMTLRAASIQHFREGWIDWERGEILIPKIDVCSCRQCWIEAHKKWLREGFNNLDEDGFWEGYDDVNVFTDCLKEHKEIILQQADLDEGKIIEYLHDQYAPKTESSARRIPFGISRRATAVFKQFFEQYDHFEWSQQHIRDLITEAAENAPGVNEDYVKPHSARADGITFFARILPDTTFVRDIAGHSDLRVTNQYVQQLGRLTTHEAFVAVDKPDSAPPIIPENKEASFPVLLDPTPFKGEPWDPRVEGDESSRFKRSEEIADQKLPVCHPREHNCPDRAGLPDNIDDLYDLDDHLEELPVDMDQLESTNLQLTKDDTLMDWQNPHDIDKPSDPDTTQKFRHDPNITSFWTDTEERVNVLLPPVSLMQVGCVNIRGLKQYLDDKNKLPDIHRMCENRLTEASQILRALGRYCDPKSPATIGKTEIATLLVPLLLGTLIAIGVIQSTVPLFESWIIVFIGAYLPLLFYPWDEIDITNVFSVNEKRSAKFNECVRK